jgi:hypothetical protein
VDDPDRLYRSGEKQRAIQKSKKEIGNKYEILDTDFHRCTQFQKAMKSIAFGGKKKVNFFPQTMLHDSFRPQADLN